MQKQQIVITKASTHNLKQISCTIPHGTLCCLTGVSGSGKSSLAFDTIFVEGQRRYVQSLSHQAKRIIGNLPKPDVESIEGLTPTIAIEQRASRGSPRSTVGTLTEIYEYMRVLFARLAIPHCPISHEPVVGMSRTEIIDQVLLRYAGQSVTILSPWIKQKKGELKDDLQQLERKGFSRVRLDGIVTRISEIQSVDPAASHDIDIVVDRLTIHEDNRQRITESTQTALDASSGMIIVLNNETAEEELLSEHAYSALSKKSYPPLEPYDFSSNNPSGMCPECQGLGECHEFILENLIDENKSLAEDCCSIAGSYQTVWHRNVYDSLSSLYNFSVHTPWKELPAPIKKLLLYGTERRWTRMVFINPNTGATWSDIVQWRGIVNEAKKKYLEAKSDSYKQQMEQQMRLSICPACQASRLRPYPSAAKLYGCTWQELTEKTVDDTLSFFQAVNFSKDLFFAKELVDQVASRLRFLQQVGLGYLSLSRQSTTLSGGEFQRVRLASQIGSSLTGITYVLDEPSIGLHPADNERLIEALLELRNRGNTVIVVEHDEQMMRSSDWILDFGPGAGSLGGSLLYQGSLRDFKKAKHSPTSNYLFGRTEIQPNGTNKSLITKKLCLHGVCHRNISDLTLEIPLERFVAITGVSGSGKSSLIFETLFPALSEKNPDHYSSITGREHIDAVRHIDQTPIGRTPRSNPATYSGVFDEIRELFASLPESKARGWTAGRFSFNVKQGSCTTCEGMGQVSIDMDFLEKAWVQCPSCEGRRFDTETLSVRYKGASILDVLNMTCREAYEFFSSIPSIKSKLNSLLKAGLEYIQLGQSATTLSGGESQRLKIAKELARPSIQKTLYLLDEPTTGLHTHDISRLLDALHEIVAQGNTVVVIEHNMDLVKTADWVIDMGPGAGVHGGKIIAQGRPEEIAQLPTATGIALHHVLSKKPQKIKSSTERSTHNNNIISVRGARQNTLKNLSFDLPKNSFIAVVGPSGSGKSSLAFDTLFAESQRQYVESLSPYARQYIHQMQKSLVDSISGLPPTIASFQRESGSNPRSTVGTITEVYDYLRVFWSRLGLPHCPKTKLPIETMSKERVADIVHSWEEETPLSILAPISSMTTTNVAAQIDAFKKLGYSRIRLNRHILDINDPLPPLVSGRTVTLDLVVDRLKASQGERGRLIASIEEASRRGDNSFIIIRNGEDRLFSLSSIVVETGESYPEITAQTFAFNTAAGMCLACEGIGKVDSSPCLACNGTRLNPLARHVTIGNLSIADFCRMPISNARQWLNTSISASLEKPIRRLFEEIDSRLRLIDELGVGYLSIDRCADTLSNGEAQRVRLASQIGSNLSGLLYILDEPTTGLHPIDTERLIGVLKKLQSLGNTIVAVDHDPALIRHAEHVIELGIEGGKEGGKIVFTGSGELFAASKSPTAIALHSPLSLHPKPPSSTPLTIRSVNRHNLENFSCSIPTQALTGIIGVSGSGKSTLLFDVIEASATGTPPYKISGFDSFSRVVTIDQQPIGRTTRSDVATFVDLSTPLRKFFATLPHAKALGLDPSHFSAFHQRGRCKECFGAGYRTIDMHFLPSARIPCESCHGLRLNPVSLSVEYKGLNVGQILALSVAEAKILFEDHWKIARLLGTLVNSGLHYLHLGQEMVSLSNGEAQRVTLAKELSSSRKSTTLYLLDEPTTGLHAQEVRLVIDQLQRLVSDGHTVVVVEHTIDMIAACDYLIELGPGAGPNGGKIITKGSPRQIAKSTTSPTGRFLRERS